MLKKFIIRILRTLHLVIVLFTLLGPALPYISALIFHMCLVPAMILQWRFNQGTCLLTNLENWIDGAGPGQKKEQDGQFIKSLLGIFCREIPADRTIKKGLYILLWSGFAISGIRVFILFPAA